MSDFVINSEGSFVLFSSQGSDLFPLEVKQCMDDPEIQDVINTVQHEDPFLSSVQKQDSQDVAVDEMLTGNLLVHQAPMASPTCMMLCTEDYPGPYDFEVHVSGENSGKNFLFSYDLNKLFIQMNKTIHLSFKCNTFPPGLYVRAIAVFCSSEDFQEPVDRCMHHCSRDNNEGIPEHLVKHVIRIEHPQALYDLNTESKRNSVRLMLESPQAGSDSVAIAFKFVCKNSCQSGMNRRPTEVIFTLEDCNAAVYGRQRMKVRICSCPKRDKTKEESTMQPGDVEKIPRGKRLMSRKDDPNPPPAKQRKTDEEFQVRVLNLQEYMIVTNLLNYMMTTRIQNEKRVPTEIESQVLCGYQQALNAHKQHPA